jgi:hypothetical protein
MLEPATRPAAVGLATSEWLCSTAAGEVKMLGLTAIAALFGLVVLGSIWSGYVLTLLWAWFVVPTFGLPPLALAPAIGLAVVVGFLTHQYTPKAAKPDGDGQWHETGRAVGHMILRPATALLVGWIVKQWV